MIRVFMFSLLSFFIFSCDKDETVITNPVIPESIIPLEVGNYWIYQGYRVESDGVVFQLPKQDSVYIDSVEIINGEEYYIFEGAYSFPPVFSYRDSSGYLLTAGGQIHYSPKDDEGVLYERIWDLSNDDFIKASFEMDTSEELTIPVGTFNTRKVVGKFDFSQSDYDCDKEFISYYAKGIGLVRDDRFFASACEKTYFELIRYNVQ